jgi:hypothetical protein
MRRALRENALCALLAAAGCATLAWLGLYGIAWTDYEVEAQPSVDALVHGHLGRFLALAPVYGGSLIERAPFALLPGLWGGGALAVYRLLAVPCLLATGVIAVVLVARMRSEGKPRLARGLVLGLCVANPLALLALEVGHAEELLGASLCVGALLLASAPQVSRGRALASGVLLGLAIANKQWAVLAVGPALLALPSGRRSYLLAASLGVAGAIEMPLLLGAASGYTKAAAAATPGSGSGIFQPWQLWWFFGHHGGSVHGLFGAPKPGYRIEPAWAATISHPLVLAVGVAIPAALWLRRRPPRLTAAAALLTLAVVLLARCVLDTWDTAYYTFSVLLALTAWEASSPGRRPPVIALVSTVLAWVSLHWLGEHASADVQAALFLAWTLPLAAFLAWRLTELVPRRDRTPGPVASPADSAGSSAGAPGRTPARLVRPRRGRSRVAQETTVSSFGSPVKSSQPPASTTARSSIRTPSSPGR